MSKIAKKAGAITLSANEMYFFIAEFERATKNQEDRHLLFFNISSGPKAIMV